MLWSPPDNQNAKHMSITADLILQNATIITCERSLPRAEALAVKDDRIMLVGREDEVDQVKGQKTRIIDCQGMTLVPGFIDAHCHIFSFIRRFFNLDLTPQSVRSIEDIKEAIRRKIKFTSPGTWIRGEGYNEFYLAEKRHPTSQDLDAISPQHPVILVHRSQHAAVLNGLGLKMVGITRESEEPAGGVIERDFETGEPNGIVFEMSDYLQERIQSPISQAEIEWGVAEANRHYLSLGLTSLGEATASNNLSQWKNYHKLKNSGKLLSRIYMMVGMKDWEEFKSLNLTTGAGDPDLKLGGVKIILSEATGQLQPSQEDLNQLVLECTRAGFQVTIHAVERNTVKAAVVALEQASREFPRIEHRHRIEHCSECPPELRSRLAQLKAVIVSQPPFIYYNGERYLAQVSTKTQSWLYPFKSLLDNGLTVAGSSDSPVVPDNPLVGIYAAVTRRAETGQRVLAPEAIGVEQALEMYTSMAANASFEENIKGSLARGKVADIVMLDSNPLRTPPERLKDISIEMTLIGGKPVWEKRLHKR